MLDVVYIYTHTVYVHIYVCVHGYSRREEKNLMCCKKWRTKHTVKLMSIFATKK